MTLVFLHIPKCAGTSTKSALRSVYGDRVFNLAKYPSEDFARRKYRTFMKRFGGRPEVVTGHIEYGIHEMIALDDVVYVTLLRDPIERCVSHWVHWMVRGRARYPESEKFTPELSTPAKLVGIAGGDLQARTLLGLATVDRSTLDPAEVAESAIQRVASGQVIAGTVDKVDRFMSHLAERFGWDGVPVLPWANVTPIERPAVRDRDMQILVENNTADQALYDYVSAQWE